MQKKFSIWKFGGLTQLWAVITSLVNRQWTLLNLSIICKLWCIFMLLHLLTLHILNFKRPVLTCLHQTLERLCLSKNASPFSVSHLFLHRMHFYKLRLLFSRSLFSRPYKCSTQTHSHTWVHSRTHKIIPSLQPAASPTNRFYLRDFHQHSDGRQYQFCSVSNQDRSQF